MPASPTGDTPMLSAATLPLPLDLRHDELIRSPSSLLSTRGPARPSRMSLTRSQSAHDAPPTTSLSHSSSNQHASSSSHQVAQQQQGSQQGQGKSEQSEDPVFGPLEKAGKVLEERLARDERWVGVGDSLIGELRRRACLASVLPVYGEARPSIPWRRHTSTRFHRPLSWLCRVLRRCPVAPGWSVRKKSSEC